MNRRITDISNTTIIIVLFLALSVFYCNKSESANLTYYAKSEHFSSLPYNQDHEFIGIELDNGLGLATFKNSYYKRSVMITYSRYWNVYHNVDFVATAGAATGYDGVNECLGSIKIKLCPVLSIGFQYSRFKYFIFRPMSVQFPSFLTQMLYTS